MTDRILVFIPCYNCEPQIGRVLGQFADVPAGVVGGILVVDNGSRDNTVQAAVNALPTVTACPATVVRNAANYNLGGSHKAAFAYATREGFTHVIVLHGDDQGSIADLLPLLQSGVHREYDACLGARFMRGARLAGYSRFRTLGNRAFNSVFSIAARRRVLDLGSGLNIFARSVFSDPAIDKYPDDLRFNVYLLLGMIDSAKRLMFFPISWREDDQVSNVKIVSQAVKTMSIANEYLFRRSDFRAAEHRQVARDAYTFETVASTDVPGSLRVSRPPPTLNDAS